MAVALANAPCTVLLLEQNKVAPVNANMLDLRTTGLTRSSEKVFSYLGLWEKLSEQATPIERMDISEQGNQFRTNWKYIISLVVIYMK